MTDAPERIWVEYEDMGKHDRNAWVRPEKYSDNYSGEYFHAEYIRADLSLAAVTVRPRKEDVINSFHHLDFPPNYIGDEFQRGWVEAESAIRERIVEFFDACALSPAAVAVKPLEWTGPDDVSAWADSPLGRFMVFLDADLGFRCMIDGHDDSWVKYPQGDDGFETMSESLAECERYYLSKMTPFVSRALHTLSKGDD